MERPLKPFEMLNALDVLDAIEAHVAILDHNGIIIHTNKAWDDFAAKNPQTKGRKAVKVGIGTDYLDVCQTSIGPSAEGALQVQRGIKSVLDGKLRQFSFEYPCHSPTRQRWFVMKVTPLRGPKPRMVVAVHTNITELKMADVKVQQKVGELSGTLEYLENMVGQIRSSLVLGSVARPLATNFSEVTIPSSSIHGGTSDANRLKSLSEREKEILLAIVRGERSCDIAVRLGLSIKSVSTYRSRVLTKVNAKSNAELVAIVTRLGLLSK
jgi:DNA-binding CsgD family transcriptional regulator